MKKGKSALELLMILAGSIVIGYLLLVLVYCIPVSPIRNNLNDAPEVLRADKTNMVRGFASTFLTDFTDGIMLGTAGYKNELPAYKAALKNTRTEIGKDAWEPPDSLEYDLSEKGGAGTYSYERYWHGYLVVLKPLLYFFHYGQIQMFNLLLQAVLLAAVAMLFYRNNITKYIVPFAAMVVFLTPNVLALSMANAVCYYIVLLAVIVQLSNDTRLQKSNNYLKFFLMIGILTSYMDFLTYPVITVGVPAVIYLILRVEQKDSEYKIEQELKNIILFMIAWGVGYAGMWAGKWILNAILINPDIFQSVLYSVSVRGGSIENMSRLRSFIAAAAKNVKIFANPPYLLFILINITYPLIRLIKNHKEWKEMGLQCLLFVFVGLLPFFWYALAPEHSEVHCTFTYRALGVTIFAGLSLLNVCCKKRKEQSLL